MFIKDLMNTFSKLRLDVCFLREPNSSKTRLARAPIRKKPFFHSFQNNSSWKKRGWKTKVSFWNWYFDVLTNSSQPSS